MGARAIGEARSEWNSGDAASSRPIQLRVEPSDHGTRVTLRCDAQSQVHLGYWAISLLGLVTVLLTVMMLAGSFEPQVWVLVAASGLGALLGLLGNEPLTRRWVAEQNNRFDVVTNRIEIIVGRDTMLETGGNE